ncbi:MAG: DUF177 domain-containing protein [Tepidanaerobacteraceae bacterium]|jgi:uncharacterized protein|nr:DUF177 domain-containing protein [Tepidanaerobacteraceae bacterium]
MARVKQSAGNAIDFNFDERINHIKVKRENVRFVEPVKVEGTLENLGNRIFEVRGLIRTAVEYPCFRCLKNTKVNFNLIFSIKFSDIPAISREDEVVAFSGEEIELRPYILEEILLNWPSQILCRPDCRGICPRCGADLNNVNCSCEDEDTDPRLAALKNFLKKD